MRLRILGWRRSVVILAPRSYRVPDHSRDGLLHKIRGIANRLTLESGRDEIDSRNSSEGAIFSLTTQTTSSTLWQYRRRGCAAGGRIKTLTWGSLTRLSALLSEVVIALSADPISNVWRFGRDLRHLENAGKIGPCNGRGTFKNLHRGTRISRDQERKKVADIPHAASQEHVSAQSVRDGVESPHNLILRFPCVLWWHLNAFPYPWHQSQPHRLTRRAKWPQKFHPLVVAFTAPSTVWKREPCVATGELRVRGNPKEDEEDKFVREFENCESGIETH